MLHHIGTVLPSAFGDLSKRITSATTAIAGQLSLTVVENDTRDGAPPPANINNDPPKEVGAEANTAFDPGLLSSHARPASSRPSSRLLKQSMRGYGGTPPRSAPLLVPGSPAFTRPWRVRGDTPGEGGRADPSRARQGRGNTSPDLLPLSSASLSSQTTVSFEDERSLLGSGGRIRQGGSIADESTVSTVSQGAGRGRRQLPLGKGRRQKQAGLLKPTGGARLSARILPSFSSCFPQLSRHPPRLAIEAVAAAEEDLPAELRISPRLAQPDTCGANTTQLVAKSSSTSALIVPLDDNPDLAKNDQCSGIEPNDEKTTKNGAKKERSAIIPAGSSQQSLRKLPEGPRKFSEGHTEPANRHADGCAGSADGVDGSGGGSGGGGGGDGTPWQEDHKEYEDVQLQPTRMSSTTRAAAVTTSAIADDPLLSPSIRQSPETFEASRRRPSIEIDAAFSRSSRLPPAPVPHSTPPFADASGSASVAASRGGGSRSAGSVSALSPGRITFPGDRARGMAAALPSGNEATIGSSSTFRASTRSGDSTGTRGGVRRGGEGGGGRQSSSGKTHRKRARGTKKLKPKQNQQQQQQQQQRRQSSVPPSTSDPLKDNSVGHNSGARSRATAAATDASWTEWRRPGELWELDARVDQANTKPEGGAVRANNGAASGAGWGGNDQMDLIAAAPKAESCFFPENQSLPGEGGYVHLQRPDTREAFYSAPIEALEAFRPCVCCFDALMRHHKGNNRKGRMDGESIGQEITRNFPEAAGDPHVAFFVRWETLDKGLGRYVPQGFMGSFTPRPFRPALAEYAVKAASEDPKFWGLGWAQIPDTRCRVIVISSLEVAQHERDWLRNRHGLLLSFEDSAGRHYQSAIFPETMCKAGWSKEHTIDALFRKAGYWKPRGCSSDVPAASVHNSSPTATATAANSTTAMSPATTAAVNSSAAITDQAVSRSAVFLRFQTVTFRMGFSKYQRASKKREKKK